MSDFELYDYQQTVADAILDYVDQRCILSSPMPHTEYLLIKAGTGVGKTAVSAALCIGLEARLSLLAPLRNVVYIFLGPNTLHVQAQEKYQEYGLGDSRVLLRGEDALAYPDGLPAGSVLFLNTPSINKESSTILADSDYGPGLGKIIEKTKAQDTSVVLIADEVHVEFFGKRTQEAVTQYLRPDLVIGMSATPEKVKSRLAPSENAYFELSDDVARAQGKIVQATLLNDEVLRYQDEYSKMEVSPADRMFLNENSQFGLYTYSAAAKRDELQFDGRDEGVTPDKVNLLSAYQLPDNVKDGNYTEGVVRKAEEKDTPEDEYHLHRVLETLRITKGWTVESGDVAIWTASHKTVASLAEVAANDSKVKALVFKAAIALGFDARRLATIAFLRDVQSAPFGRQVLGRSARSLEGRLYSTKDSLNYAYAYTHHELMTALIENKETNVRESQRAGVKEQWSEVFAKWSALPLTNYFNQRQSQNTLSVETAKERWNRVVGAQMSGARGLDALMELGFQREFASVQSIPQGRIVDLDENESIGTVQIRTLAGYLESQMGQLAHEIATSAGYAGVRSMSAVTETLRQFAVSHGLDKNSLYGCVQGSEHNRVRMRELWREAFPESTGDKSQGDAYVVTPTSEPWTIPAEQMLLGKATQDAWYLYDRREVELDSAAERDFASSMIPMLVASGKGLRAYFKAPARGKESLGVPYRYGKERLTYPDWFLLYDDRVLVIETKSYCMSKPNPEEIVAKAKGIEERFADGWGGYKVETAVINLSAFSSDSTLETVDVVHGDGTTEPFGGWLKERGLI